MNCMNKIECATCEILVHFEYFCPSLSIKHAGMEEASCKKAAYVSDYLDNIDDITVIQGPAARIRPKRVPDEFFSCKQIDLAHHTIVLVCLFMFCFLFNGCFFNYKLFAAVDYLQICCKTCRFAV